MRRLVNGLTALLPLVVVMMLLEKIFLLIRTAVHSLLAAFPGSILHSPALKFIAVLSVCAFFLWFVGWLADRSWGRNIGLRLERGFFFRLPLYPVIRNLVSGLAGKDDEQALKPVAVEVNPGIRQWGFLVERHGDNRCTIFLPASPATAGGTVLNVDAALVQELAVPGHRIVQCLSAWGHGADALTRAEVRSQETKGTS